MIAPPLPATLAPRAPFAPIVSQSRTQEVFAPGMRRATYRLTTAQGPLVINVVALDLTDPSVRVGVVLAHDRLVSPGETVASMARRTGAVAGINADYFDIGQTNQPQGIVVADGELLRTPVQRVALDVRRDGSVHFENIALRASLAYGTASIPLTGVNEWPPQGGATLVDGAFGAMRAAPEVTVATLVPADAAHDPAELSGTYRVAEVASADAARISQGTLLGLGPAAQALAPLLAAGDSVMIDASLTPPLDDLRCAVGGGPLLLRDGEPVDDPSAPAPEERNVRLPVAGAATTASAHVLLLVEVDGRAPGVSGGVDRPQFAALLKSLGARDAMAFDSGGSATLVARRLGDALPDDLGVPSDGSDRPVADGLFAYSDAALGPPAALIARPASLVALPGADVVVHLAIVDAAGHLLGSPPPAVVHAGAHSGDVSLEARGLQTVVPVHIQGALAKLDVESDVRVVAPDSVVRLRAIGYDASGAVVQLGREVRWEADRGAFIRPGEYRATAHDARIIARAGGLQTQLPLLVGTRRIVLPNFPSEVRVPYDFTESRRPAVVSLPLALPGEPLQFSADVDGDASGVALHVVFVNRFGERRALTLAKRVDWSGWRTQTIALPPDLNPPVQLRAIYALPPAGSSILVVHGALGLRRATVVVAGSP